MTLPINPRSPTFITTVVLTVLRVLNYVVGVAWPEQAETAKYITDQLTPILLVIAIYFLAEQHAAATAKAQGVLSVPDAFKLNGWHILGIIPALIIMGIMWVSNKIKGIE